MATSNNDTSGRISAQELQFASWWVRNRLLVTRIGYGVLIGLCAATWGYALWGLLDAYAISYPRESRITREIALNQQRLAALETDRPQNANLTEVTVLQTVDNRFDMAAEVVNPNEQWWAEFNYRFTISGEQTPIRNGYVLPQSRQILTELGYKPSSRGGRSATLVFENVRWHRIDPSFVGVSYPEFAKKRLDLAFENVKYDTDIAYGTRKIGQSSFLMVNRGAYGYRDLDLVVRLYRGAAPVAINKIRLTNVAPGERRSVQMVWLENIPSVGRTEIVPQINILDPEAYLPTQYFER